MDPSLTKILRAESPRSEPNPTYRYWNAEAATWGRFDQATRYSPNALPSMPYGPNNAASVAWIDDLPRDIDGYPYIPTRCTGLWRVTLCCAHMAGIDDGPLYCKSCHEEVDIAVDTPARLDANWQPGDGPLLLRFRLG